MVRPKRVLFFAEAVTLAHVARPIALAQSLDRAAYECTIACDTRYERFLQGGPFRHVPLGSISSAQFLAALATGSPVYSLNTLRGYVREDLALIERWQPDVVVGDFRLSLSASARLARVPYVAISNAYWSPYYARPGFPMPVLPMTKVLPLPVAQTLFRLVSPWVMPGHSKALNRLRTENGLSSLGPDLRRAYTDADLTLYADDPALFALRDAPDNHRLMGPVLWEPAMPPPPWWGALPADRPIVYVSLGSSGPKGLLKRVMRALSDLPVCVIASSAGAPVETPRQGNAFVAPYLPGTAAAARSSLVICNGGSLTAYQALVAGVPLIGIATNMDQFLNMEAVTAAGAGHTIRSDRMGIRKLQTCVDAITRDPEVLRQGQTLARALTASNAGVAFERTLNSIFRPPPG